MQIRRYRYHRGVKMTETATESLTAANLTENTGIIAAFAVPHPPLIVPAVGRGHESIAARTIASYNAVAEKIAALKPDTIVISSPHAEVGMLGFVLPEKAGLRGSFAQFRAPEVTFAEEVDTELRDELVRDSAPGFFIPLGSPELDHGTMVPLWFIRKYLSSFRLLVTGYAARVDFAAYYRAGKCIQKAALKLGRRTVYVASGDLSHKLQEDGPYGFVSEGPEYDARIMDVLGRAAFGELFSFDSDFCDRAAECGHRSFVMMAGALDGYEAEPHVYSHEDRTGVGYGVVSFMRGPPDSSRSFA